MRWLIGFILLLMFAAASFGLLLMIKGRANTWRMIAGPADFGPMNLSEPFSQASRPNDALVCSQGLCGNMKIDLVLPTYDITPDALIAKIEEAFRQSSLDYERVDDGNDAASIRFVTRTPTMGFPDTNWFQVVEMEDGSTGLIAYAKARVGYSDRGNNLKRLTKITAGLSSGS